MRSIRVGPEEHGKFLAACARTPKRMYSCARRSADDEVVAVTFEFRPGPIFANIVLCDEINRTTPRTQSAMLEAMSEATVSAEGEVRALPRANPRETMRVSSNTFYASARPW